MKKRESTFLNMLIVLMLIALVAGFLLGYVNEITLEPKAKVQLKRKTNALKQVLPTFDNNLLEDKILLPVEGDSVEVFPAYNNNKLVGLALEGKSDKGFSGLVKTMVGFTPEGKIYKIVVIEQKETPGLGTKMKEPKFLQQFEGQSPETFDLRVKKDGGQVDALTGATISTRAFSETVSNAYSNYKESIKTLDK
ncbi:MAG: RnfABCDGE type electron transport complex subunit G [Flavobacteriia bacterium]|nr:MAG: RnfABCDGE type electron transport complex subunit G [Flavobacteriia bacterium]